MTQRAALIVERARAIVLRLARQPWTWIALAALVLTLAWLRPGPLSGTRDATWARIEQTGVWRVGMDPSFPPFENYDSVTGQPAGLDVDLVNAIAAHWGVRAEIAGVGFDQLIDAVAAHRLDSAVSGLPAFPDRTRDLAFSSPYVEAGIVLAAPPGSPIRGPDDLGGKRVAAEWGSQGDAQARALQKRLEGGFELVLRESPDAALAAVENGAADAVITDAISLALYRQGGGTLNTVGAPLLSDPYVIVVPKDAPELLRAVNDALAALASDGALDEIRARWLDGREPGASG
jgi:ABC-type amino acid transport substrate-binding protein